MKEKTRNIYTIFDEILQRKDKEILLNQSSKVIWMTGLSGSGKTTIAKGVEKYLYSKGIITQILDGDNLRAGINNDLTFSSQDRNENIRRVSEISKLFINCGIITINCFISPTIKIRKMAKDIIGKENFIEIYINASIEECKKRDVKGLYKKAENKKIKNFTGISSPFESPKKTELEIDTTKLSINESIQKVIDYILPKIKHN